jgi:hypothetical protein
MLSKYGKVCIIKTSRGCRRRKVYPNLLQQYRQHQGSPALRAAARRVLEVVAPMVGP